MRLQFKAIKIQGKLLKIVQSFLLLLILTILYWQLSKFNWSSYSLAWPDNILTVVSAFVLIFVNWFFEWLKWNRITQRIGLFEPELAKKGFYAGMISGFLTPSALGNFIGRMAEVESHLKAKVVSHTFFANGAQFLVSLAFGLISLMILSDQSISFMTQEIFFSLISLTIALVMLFFFVHRIPFLKSWLSEKAPSISSVSLKDKGTYLLFSTMRYLVFSFQFYLVILAFQPELNLVLWIWIWNLYLWTTLSPSILMGKLLVRESLAVFILTQGGVELPIALFASLLVWIMNNAMPSIYAYFKWKNHVLVKA